VRTHFPTERARSFVSLLIGSGFVAGRFGVRHFSCFCGKFPVSDIIAGKANVALYDWNANELLLLVTMIAFDLDLINVSEQNFS